MRSLHLGEIVEHYILRANNSHHTPRTSPLARCTAGNFPSTPNHSCNSEISFGVIARERVGSSSAIMGSIEEDGNHSVKPKFLYVHGRLERSICAMHACRSLRAMPQHHMQSGATNSQATVKASACFHAIYVARYPKIFCRSFSTTISEFKLLRFMRSCIRTTQTAQT